MSIEVVICAAGRGTRLEFDGPKTLFPINGKPILEWIVGELPPELTKLALVCSPVHAPALEEFIQQKLRKTNLVIRVVLQPNAIGTADAVYRAISTSAASYCLIAWGDQIGLARTTFDKILEKTNQEYGMVLPLIESHSPYVNFEFNEHFEIISFNETKKTGKFENYAYTDCGTFLVKKQQFAEFLEETTSEQDKDIFESGECNILNLFHLYENRKERISKVILFDQEIRTSVNNPLEALEAEKYIGRRLLENE
jgi:bifunctional N-acetylglucosamine-1-phosphate-uridyltransferase/glucosamine-1-phosphate-acetyltransferase GlmU-like protein